MNPQRLSVQAQKRTLKAKTKRMKILIQLTEPAGQMMNRKTSRKAKIALKEAGSRWQAVVAVKNRT